MTCRYCGLPTDDDASVCEPCYDQHCPVCGAEWVWHGRAEDQRVCAECRSGSEVCEDDAELDRFFGEDR